MKLGSKPRRFKKYFLHLKLFLFFSGKSSITWDRQLLVWCSRSSINLHLQSWSISSELIVLVIDAQAALFVSSVAWLSDFIRFSFLSVLVNFELMFGTVAVEICRYLRRHGTWLSDVSFTVNSVSARPPYVALRRSATAISRRCGNNSERVFVIDYVVESRCLS